MGRNMRAGKKPKKQGMSGGNMKQQMAQVQAMQRQMEEMLSFYNFNSLSQDDIEMLQDLIMTATNEAIRQAEELSNSEMSKLTSGLGLPPGLL